MGQVEDPAATGQLVCPSHRRKLLPVRTFLLKAKMRFENRLQRVRKPVSSTELGSFQRLISATQNLKTKMAEDSVQGKAGDNLGRAPGHTAQ
jgi:hypothetical protein